MDSRVESKSKTKILNNAKNLFWKHGIRRVSVQEICKEAGVSKMTFYRHFENKEDVAFQVIDNLYHNNYKTYREIMDSSAPFAEKVVQMIKTKRDNVTGISKELVKDIFENNNEKLQNLIQGLRQKNIENILKDFAKAQENGEIRKDIKLEFILYILNDMNNKMQDEQLQKLYQNEEDLIMELTNYFFYGIMSENL